MPDTDEHGGIWVPLVWWGWEYLCEGCKQKRIEEQVIGAGI